MKTTRFEIGFVVFVVVPQAKEKFYTLPFGRFGILLRTRITYPKGESPNTKVLSCFVVTGWLPMTLIVESWKETFST